MKNERLELTRGSGNVYRDLGHANADVKQFRSVSTIRQNADAQCHCAVSG